MAGLVLAFGMLSVPAGHHVVAHRILVRGHEPTPHELAHRARSRPVRLAANAAWFLYLAGTVLLAFVLRLW